MFETDPIIYFIEEHKKYFEVADAKF